MTPSPFAPPRAGRMARWQRLGSYVVLGLCAASGLVWFLGMDVLALAPPPLRLWWVLHGITGMLAALAIGAALPQHALMAWRARRNRGIGALLGATLAVLMLSALCLLYGLEQWHDAGHWTHVVVGLACAAAFPLHIWRGRRRTGPMRSA